LSPVFAKKDKALAFSGQRRETVRCRFLRADRLIDTNSMELAVYGNDAEEQILAVASLDNLGKGASGAAVQVINLKTGVDETTGLAVAA
jgi:N-acetyl-gamma-glutamyl-phosphate reductase